MVDADLVLPYETQLGIQLLTGIGKDLANLVGRGLLDVLAHVEDEFEVPPVLFVV